MGKRMGLTNIARKIFESQINLLGWLLHFVLLRRIRNDRVSVGLPRAVETNSNSNPKQLVHLNVNEWSFFSDLIFGYDLGFAESYMQGKWDTGDLTALFRNLRADSDKTSKSSIGNYAPLKLYSKFWQRLRVRNTPYWSKKNIHGHYDFSNQFFANFLDKGMTYSCARFDEDNATLEDAQEYKIASLFKDSGLKRNDRILDVGCGWGRLAIKAAEEYDCEVVGVTLSEDQYEYALERVRERGLEDRVEILLQDYRSVTGEFDHVYSIEMLEAVGEKGLEEFLMRSRSLLVPGGTLNLQVITIPNDRYDEYKSTCDFIQRYIFPGGLLPSLEKINEAIDKTGQFEIEAERSIGRHYASKLRFWKENLLQNLPVVKELGFDDRDIRRFLYYFSYCEAGFLDQLIDDYQMRLRRT